MCSFTISISAATSRASHVHLSWMTKGHWTNAKVCLRKMHSCQSSFETTLISRHHSSRFSLLPWQLYEQNTWRFSHPHKRFTFIIQMNIQWTFTKTPLLIHLLSCVSRSLFGQSVHSFSMNYFKYLNLLIRVFNQLSQLELFILVNWLYRFGETSVCTVNQCSSF